MSIEHAEQAPPGILVGGGVAVEISAEVIGSGGGRQVGWLDAVPGVWIMARLVAEGPFVAPETVQSASPEMTRTGPLVRSTGISALSNCSGFSCKISKGLEIQGSGLPRKVHSGSEPTGDGNTSPLPT